MSNVKRGMRLATLNSYRHTMRILLFLHNSKDEKINQTNLRHGIDVLNSQTIQNSLEPLEDLGLIDTRMEMPRTMWISLTDKGEKIASIIEQLNEILEKDP